MFGLEILDLKKENGRRFYYDKIRIQKLKKEIEDFLEEETFLDNFNFSRKMILSLEIKTNNALEGLVDDVENIEKIIKNNTYYGQDRTRILNLYYGYRYILLNNKINKDSLKKLYSILSKNLLDETSKNNMGEYYRKGDVLIFDNYNSHYLSSFDKGMSPEKVEDSMDDLFAFIEKNDKEKLLDIYIKSQIIHFYLVYIHPYYDVNGRTARTLSLWYLLQKKAYPFVIFNRGMSLSRTNYKKAIKKARKGNITPFLEYSLKTLKAELEKEKIICNVRSNYATSIPKEEYEILEYILTVKTHKLKDILNLYKRNNYPVNDEKILLERIYPLIEKEIVILDEKEQTLKINQKFVTIDKKKIKKLRVKSYISE